MTDSTFLETAQAAIERIRTAYQENLYVGLCTWFDEFDRAVFTNEFAVCEGLLKEVRQQRYPLSALEQQYVESREGVLWLKQGIEAHRRREFEAAEVAYQCSLETQQRVQCKEAQSDVQLLQKQLADDRTSGTPAQEMLDLLAKELKVLGGSETLLCDRIHGAPPKEQPKILLAAIQIRHTKPMLQAITTSKHAQTRRLAIAGLGRFQTVAEVEPLLNILQDSSWFIRWRATELLIQAEIDCQSCEHKNSMGREFCSACSAILNAEQHAVLCRALAQETAPEPKRSLIQLLGQFGNQQAVPGLITALDDADADVRLAAIDALINTGQIKVLHEKKQQIRPGKSLFQGSVEQKLQSLASTLTERAAQLLRQGTPIATIVVSQSGDADYRRIGDAITNADPGTRILVRSGTYAESLILNKPLEIIGEGTVTLKSSQLEGILMQTEFAIVRNLSVNHHSENYFAVAISQGELLLESCEVFSSSLACVSIHNSDAIPTIRKCRIQNRGQQGGIVISRQGSGTIEDCDIFANTISGIEIKEQATPTIRQCRLYNGKSSGIYVHTQGSGTIEDCDIFDNDLAGILITQGANPTVRQCRLHNGKANGILIREQGQGTIEDCDIYSNAAAGVAITQNSTPMVRKCRISKGKEGGILVYQQGQGIIEDCDIFDNTVAGIEIKESEEPLMIRRCLIQNGQRGGILAHNQGLVIVEDCSIFNNRLSGIEIRNKAMSTVRRCRVHEGQAGGIFILEKGEAIVEDCSIYNNADDGIQLYSGSRLTICHSFIHDGRGAGINFSQSQGTVESCNLFGNTYSGVVIGQDSNVAVRQCRIHAGGASGIYVYEQGQGTVENCNIFDNTNSGITIEQSQSTYVRQCYVRQNKRNGILIQQQGRGTIENCTISSNSIAGVVIDGKGTRAVIRNAQINQNTYPGILVGNHGAGTVENCDLTNNQGGAWKIEEGCQVSRQNNQE